MNISTNMPVNYASFGVTPIKHRVNTYQVTLGLPSKKPASAAQLGDISVELWGQHVTITCPKVPFCNGVYMPSAAHTGIPRTVVGYGLDWAPVTSDDPKGPSYASAAFTATSPSGVGYSSNGVDVEGRTQTLAISWKGPAQRPPALEIGYGVPNADAYDWVDGPDFLALGNDGMVWVEPAGSATIAHAFSATDRSAQRRDNFAAFLAGALIGIAGAALIASLQESLSG